MDEDGLRDLLWTLLRRYNVPFCVLPANVHVNITQYPTCIVRNTAKAGEWWGHWVAFFVTSPTTFEAFDSYANSIDVYRDIIKPEGTCVRENYMKIQQRFTYLCGEYCAWWLYSRVIGISYDSFIYRFSNNLGFNDNLVRRFIASVPNLHPHLMYTRRSERQTCFCLHQLPEFDKCRNKRL